MKVYRRHVNKAISIIEDTLGIRVETCADKDFLTSSGNPWILVRQSIKIGIDSRPETVLAAVAHELGHCLSVRRGSASNMGLSLIDRMKAPLTKKQKKLILKEERDAWTLGYRFLRSNGLPITDWMRYARRVLIDSHVRRLGL